jgi:hypothetical protein
VEFIVADRGAPLKRVPVDKCHEFWASEVKRHLLSPHGKVDRSKLPDEYGYVASEWSGRSEFSIVLLEKTSLKGPTTHMNFLCDFSLAA